MSSLCIGIVLFLPAAAATACPADWTPSPTRAAWGPRCYLVPPERSTSLSRCVELCEEHGGAPACIGSAEENRHFLRPYGRRHVVGDRSGGGERAAGLGVGRPRAALSIAFLGVAIVELAARCAFRLGERVRRGLKADVARGEPYEFVGRVAVMGRPELVKLDSGELVRVEAVANDGVWLLDEDHQRSDAEDAVEDLQAAPEGDERYHHYKILPDELQYLLPFF